MTSPLILISKKECFLIPDIFKIKTGWFSWKMCQYSDSCKSLYSLCSPKCLSKHDKFIVSMTEWSRWSSDIFWPYNERLKSMQPQNCLYHHSAGQFPISRQTWITWFIILFPTQILSLFQFLLLKHTGSRSFWLGIVCFTSNYWPTYFYYLH